MQASRGSEAGRSGRAGGARVSSSGGTSGDSASSSSSSLLDLSRASTSGLGGSLSGSRSLERASTVVTVLLNVVLVQSESELVLNGAHAVGTELASGSVGVQTSTVSVSADNTEESTVLGLLDAIAHNTTRLLRNAVAKVGIGGRREGSGMSEPGRINGWAALQDSVGRGVRSLVDTSRGDAGNLVGVRSEVGHLADASAINDGDET